jgi:hypothetical protein
LIVRPIRVKIIQEAAMFITHFHLLALYAQILKIFATIKWPQSGWKSPEWPDFDELYKLERMGEALETSLLLRPDLVPVHTAIRDTFQRIENRKNNGRDHEDMRNNLRKVRAAIGNVLQNMPRLPIRPLDMCAQSDLEHFDRPYGYP